MSQFFEAAVLLATGDDAGEAARLACSYVGTVNDDAFLGLEPGTVLLHDAMMQTDRVPMARRRTDGPGWEDAAITTLRLRFMVLDFSCLVSARVHFGEFMRRVTR